jgi:hypothetical protein
MEEFFCLAGSPGWRVASLGELGGGYINLCSQNVRKMRTKVAVSGLF